VSLIRCELPLWEEDIPSVKGTVWESWQVTYFLWVAPDDPTELLSKESIKKNNLYEILEFHTDGSFYINNELQGIWSQSEKSITIILLNGEEDKIYYSSGSNNAFMLTRSWDGFGMGVFSTYHQMNAPEGVTYL